MARNRTCPHCRQEHDRTTPCRIAAITDRLRKASDQRAADAAESAVIRRYLRRDVLGHHDAA